MQMAEMEQGYYLAYIDLNYPIVGKPEYVSDFRFYSIIRINNESVFKVSIVDEEYLLGSKYSIFSSWKNFAKIQGYSIDKVVGGLKEIDEKTLKDIPLESFKLVKPALGAGHKYNSVYRPVITKRVYNFLGVEAPDIFFDYILYADDEIANEKDYFDRINHLEILIAELKNIFKTVYADSNNLNTFGHNIRNLIILAATEVDDMMKNILSNNGIKKKIYKTNDYYPLLYALKLNKYKVKFSRYFIDESFSPFSGWAKEEPTKSLEWYDAYNKIKHDRTNSFPLASIKNAIFSICAVAILIAAQYGYRNDIWKESISTFLSFADEPEWAIEDFYIPLGGRQKDTLINYPFVK